MYAGPGQVKESGSKINGAMYEQSFGRENHCSPYLDAGRKVCILKCIQRNDYGMLRNQFTRESRTLRMGVLFLGNIDMHKNMEEILTRYRGYGKTVRIVSIPGNEDVSKWNPEFPWKFEFFVLQFDFSYATMHSASCMAAAFPAICWMGKNISSFCRRPQKQREKWKKMRRKHGVVLFSNGMFLFIIERKRKRGYKNGSFHEFGV